ncbi:MAG TPA: thiol reductant ABC exporter subunit CydD [Nocardioidaceae bacterium]|nr:thiol reductant ABC exporter subunit CydD [Nocardioidaceae bacterium]
MKPLDPRLLPHLTPARAPLAGVVAASTFSGILLVGQAFAVAALVTSLFSGATSGSWDGALRAGFALGVITVGRALMSWLVDVLSARASALVTSTLRHRLLTAALALGPYRLSRRRSGEVALLTTRGVAAIDPYLTRYLPALVVAAALPALTVVAIATQDLLSAVIVLATLPLVPVFAVLVGMATRDRADRQWRSLAQLSGHFVDVMRGLPTLVAYRRAKAQSASIRAVTDRYRRATNETLRLAFASSAVLELVATISVALVAVVVGLRLAAGSLDLGTALVVLLLAPEAYWPLRRVGAEFHAAAEGTATFEAAESVLSDAAGPEDTRSAAPMPAITRPVGSIVLDDVTVSYPGRDAPVLHHLTASFPARGVTAVVGPSGSGKSTLLSALMGHLPLQAGHIEIDGRVVDPASADWRSQVAWVPQRPWIATASVADNVRIGRPDADDLQVWAALQAVGLDDVVANLPEGLHEQIGEDGAGLSAGERARLALARAVVAERPVVLLDEPTAHLDALTESVIADTVTALGRRSCVVVVAHREALVERAEHVVEVPLRAVPAQRSGPSQRSGSSGNLLTGPVLAPAPAASAAPAAPADSADAAESADAAGTGAGTGAGAVAVPVVAADPVTDRTSAASADGRSVPATPATTSTPDASRGSARARLALGSALGALAAASGVALTATAGWLIARAAEHPPVLMLMVAIVGVRTFGLARPALRYAERLVSHDVALRLLADRRAEVYDALVPLVPGRLGRQRGDVLASIVDDVDSLVDRYLRVRSPLVTYSAVAVLATMFAGWVLPIAGLVTGLAVLLGGSLAYGVSRAGVERAEEAYVDGRAALSSEVMHTLQGAADLIMWQADARAVDRVDRAGAVVSQAATRSARAVATGRALAVLAGGVGVVATAWAGAPALAEGRVSAPMLALLVLLPLALLEVVSPLADVGALQVRVEAADRRLATLAETSPAVRDPALPVPPPATASTPSVVLRDVSAGWDAGAAFQDLDLDLSPGARIGVVGPSGSGKSTLAAVLMRFLDPQTGSVSIGGVPARAMLLDDVRRRVGFVDDDPHVFASTVLENVRLARPDATRAEVEGALRSVHLGPWLDGLPDGLDALLGDGHAHVSGGERARIGMARAVLADLPVLVLDEPTAHLDSGTAEAVAADLLDATSGHSVVWITHTTVGLDRVDDVLDLSEHYDATSVRAVSDAASSAV